MEEKTREHKQRLILLKPFANGVTVYYKESEATNDVFRFYTEEQNVGIPCVLLKSNKRGMTFTTNYLTGSHVEFFISNTAIQAIEIIKS